MKIKNYEYIRNNNENARMDRAFGKLLKMIPNEAAIYATMLIAEFEANEIEEFEKDFQALMKQPSNLIVDVCSAISTNNKQIDLSLAEDELIKRKHCPALTKYALNVESADKNRIAQVVLQNEKTSPEDLCKFATAIPNKLKYDFMDKVIESKKTKLNYECARCEAESITGKTLDVLKDRTSKKYVEKCLTVVAKNDDDPKIIKLIESNEKLSPYWNKLGSRPTLPPR